MKRYRDFIAATFAYAIFWVVTRWPAIAANVLLLDDFDLPLRPSDFYIGPFRPTLYIEYVLFELVIPHHFWMPLTKYVGALYIGIAAAFFMRLLRAWDVDPLIAALLPLVVFANPVLNDGPIWNTYYNLPIAYALITGGAIAWTHGRKLTFAFLTALGILGYQIFLTLAVIYAIAEPVIRRRFRLRDFIERMAILAGCIGVQLIVTALIRRFHAYSDPRGFTASLDPMRQLHGAVDLMVNGWMPVIAYYTGALRAMSLWKYLPIIFGGATWLTTRRFWPALFATAIFVIPALPNLALDRAPFSWRVSAPEAFAIALALVPLLCRVPRIAAIIVIAALTIVMIPVAHYESWCRAESWRRDEALASAIGQRDHTVVLAAINPEKHEEVALVGPHDLTWGFARRSPRMWTEFNDPWMAKRYVENYARLKFIDCNETPTAPLCAGTTLACEGNRSDVAIDYPRAIHDDARKITVVCPRGVRN
ncbi:MAG: hypothetical protein QOI24_2915 [Acidobacteriota bacterium]|jgi:hypothetical protein|nr:hypothetical protein [Acidobacteriota bacterium]